MNISLARNILTTLSARIIVLGLALVSSMVLARALGPEQRGLLALVMLLPSLATTFGLLGFDHANAVHAGLEPTRRRALVWHSLITALVVGTLIALALSAYIAMGAPGLDSHLQGPLWLFILPVALVPARLLQEYWSAAVRGMNQIFAINVLEVGMKVASLTLVILLVVVFKTGVAGAIWTDAAMVITMVLVLAICLRFSDALGRPTFDRALWKRTSRYAMTAYPGSVMTFLNYRLDQFIIVFLLPLDQLAFYVLAVEIAERLWIIPGAVQVALLPHLTNSPRRDPALAAAIARHAVLWMGVGCLAAFALAGVAVELVYSSAFVAAAAPLRWLLPGIFTLTVSKILVIELAAREKIGFIIWLMALAAFTNAGLNFVLIPHLGIAGAAIASSITYTLVSFVITWYYVRETGVPWARIVPGRTDLALYSSLIRRFQKPRATTREAALSGSESLQ